MNGGLVIGIFRRIDELVKVAVRMRGEIVVETDLFTLRAVRQS